MNCGDIDDERVAADFVDCMLQKLWSSPNLTSSLVRPGMIALLNDRTAGWALIPPGSILQKIYDFQARNISYDDHRLRRRFDEVRYGNRVQHHTFIPYFQVFVSAEYSYSLITREPAVDFFVCPPGEAPYMLQRPYPCVTSLAPPFFPVFAVRSVLNQKDLPCSDDILLLLRRIKDQWLYHTPPSSFSKTRSILTTPPLTKSVDRSQSTAEEEDDAVRQEDEEEEVEERARDPHVVDFTRIDDWRTDDDICPTGDDLNIDGQYQQHLAALGEYALEKPRLAETVERCPSWCLESSKGKKRIRQIVDAYEERQKRLRQS